MAAHRSFAIHRVAVLGSGVMGAGIAGLIASAGYPVLLLDRVVPDTPHRNSLAEAALERLREQRGVLAETFLKNITIGNIEDDLAALSEVDWVIEVVIEQLGAKQELYERIQPYLSPHAVLSSNTSTIPLAMLKQSLPKPLAERFCITHFFNPPLDMALVELVTHKDMKPKLADTVQHFIATALGKEVVRCHDTPGFIANRIGCYFLELALQEALTSGVALEDADQAFSRGFGLPSTGVFGLWDLIGIDLMPKIARALLEYLPESDAFTKEYQLQPVVQKMITEGYIGRKGKGGFYRIVKMNGGKQKEVRNLATGAYVPQKEAVLPFLETPMGIWESEHPVAIYARNVWIRMLHYALSLAGEVADDVHAIDDAMRYGYGWKKGPFAYVDSLGGPKHFAALASSLKLPKLPIVEAAGDRLFYGNNTQVMGLTGEYQSIKEDSGFATLEALLEGKKSLFSNASTSLFPIDTQVLCLLLTSKMGVLSEESFEGILEAVAQAETAGKALLIANTGPHFCAGADIRTLYHYAEHDLWKKADALLALGQKALLALYQAKIPVVVALRGAALGGGCEILLHSHAVQTIPKVKVGLVEAQLGIIPGWAGGTMMLYQALQAVDPSDALVRGYSLIAQAVQSPSCYVAAEYGYLPNPPLVTMHPRRLFTDAIALAKTMLPTFKPHKIAKQLVMPDTEILKRKSDILVIEATDPHDQTVRQKLLTLFTAAGEETTSIAALHQLERKLFLELLQTEAVLERMRELVG